MSGGSVKQAGLRWPPRGVMATLPIQVPAGSAGEAYLRGCLVVMVEPAQDWDGDDLPSDLLDGS